MTVKPPYSLFAEITDLVHHDKFLVPAHATTIRIDGGETQDVWVFDRLPGGKSETKHVHDFFVKKKTCGNYECRRIFVNLGFRTDGAPVFPTEPGDHEVVVTATDYALNSVTKTFRWRVQ